MGSVAVFAELQDLLFKALPTETAELASLIDIFAFKGAQGALDTISRILDISLIQEKNT